MSDTQIRILKDYEVSMRGSVKYTCEVWHEGLLDYRVITSTDEEVLNNKVNAHIAKLEEKWAKTQERNKATYSKEASLREAEHRTKSAESDLEALDELLIFTLGVDDTINWSSLLDNSPYKILDPGSFVENQIANLIKPFREKYLEPPIAPKEFNQKYTPNFNLIEKIIPSLRKGKIESMKNLFDSDIAVWSSQLNKVRENNEVIDKNFNENLKKYDEKIASIRAVAKQETEKWKLEKEKFEQKQLAYNLKVEKLKSDYLDGKQAAIAEACEVVLTSSLYPDYIQKNFEVEYNPDTKILVIEYSLPSPDQLPTLKEVKFIRNELKEYHLSESQIAKNFDETIYKITLRSIHEVFEADQINAIEAISFNGWVNSINKSTGKRTNNCIVSIQVKKEEFIQIDLKHVDPKACFKSLKGVASSKLIGLTSVQPILKIDKTDKRFVKHYDVADSIDDSTNIASMGWEDFEHLIREVFAKEFNQNGGEVKVTQASKDGGVDAIAFDPDPIRGGKIVIQAKRYTNTVGVSAVRDLYGTVMNEGATKGILVTTADYGPDAYEFSKGKPITLMNGANLLYLLEKHGHKAKIDIKEAKLLMKNK